MKLSGTMLVLGAKRREYQGKTYCDLYCAGDLDQGADSVGYASETHRADPKLVDAVRHVKLPARMEFEGSLTKYGDKAVISVEVLRPVKAQAPA